MFYLRAGLAERAGGLDADLDWAHTLSLGEQQRIAFLRLLVHRPAVAVLDGARLAERRALRSFHSAVCLSPR
jgi:ABC-type uncharacterized transport system fused permease/ATPase subunit